MMPEIILCQHCRQDLTQPYWCLQCEITRAEMGLPAKPKPDWTSKPLTNSAE